MLNTPESAQTCSSSPISARLGSVESVLVSNRRRKGQRVSGTEKNTQKKGKTHVFPVPLSPKNSVTSPFSSPSFALECKLRLPNLTGWM